MKKLLCLLLALTVFITPAFAAEYDFEIDDGEWSVEVFDDLTVPASASELSIPAPSAILMERDTGAVLYEKNADEKLRPASVTKVMTILLIAEAIDSGDVSLDDTVTTSAFAASMGGSQVYLKEGETMTVRDMLKCIVVVSANDCAVAMAEHLAGSESAFAGRMNARAAELGMVNTHFTNCTGLYDDDEHLTTARDIAIMSREVIKHKWLRDFTQIWTDTIRNGEFGLTNTNKLIRYFPGATGLKTGYTSKAGRCLAASAERDGVEYVAVVLNCATSDDRFNSAKTLLSYGFSTFTLVPVEASEPIPPVEVTLGRQKYVQPVIENCDPVLVRKSDVGRIERAFELDGRVDAPVSEGEELGYLVMTLDGAELARVPLIAAESVERLTLWDLVLMILTAFGR
ncbi:MAG: D-alanyl-D-alanine carboxypeptidase [Oscillospiraceae bacterium]|nr:D-alanyl-D-alanine carboxypeptidase [Oscillospiraceae bacterium]